MPVSVAEDISVFLPATQRTCFCHTHVLRQGKERIWPMPAHRAPSVPGQKPLLNQPCHGSCSGQVPCYRGKGQIHLGKKIFCSNHLDLYLSKERNALFSISNMLTDVALKADVFTTLHPTQVPLPAMHISATQNVSLVSLLLG